MKRPSRITVPQLVAFKEAGEKITMLTAYDFPTAALVDAAGVEAVLVGDSLSMVVQGHETTLPVTFEQIKYHAEMVGRAVQHALVIVDLPFPTNHLGVHRVIELAGQLLKEARETKDKIISEAKEQAKTEANKVVAEAQAAINAQKMAALTEVKNQVGKLVIEVSEKVLRKELANKEAQEAHIKGLVDGVKLN